MKTLRTTASMLAAVILFGLVGCTPTINAQSDRYGSPAPMRQSQAPGQGMSTKKKVLLLAGAAALYYMYNKHKNAQGTGPQGQYYRSKNGQIYYRDRNHKPVWVTAPTQPIQVPAADFERYTGQRAPDYNGGVISQAPAGW